MNDGCESVLDFVPEQTLRILKSTGTSAKCQWIIKDLTSAVSSQNSIECIYSDAFEVDEVPWRLVLFPNGNGVRYMSLYLDLANAHALPTGWSRVSFFEFTVKNVNPAYSVTQQAEKVFFLGLQDWGFRKFIPLSTLYEEDSGFFDENDFLTIEMSISVSPNTEFADSDEGSTTPRTSGSVGMSNQGATCYLNSLLQTFFHISVFRAKVFEAPVGDVHDFVEDEDDDYQHQRPHFHPETKSDEPDLVLALQRVFYNLQFQKRAVTTKELTQAFGWNQEDAFRQHDIHELTRVLCSSLEERLKNTKVSGTLDSLFKGTLLHTISCTGKVCYESCTEEAFFDLQLNVKGFPTLSSSLDQYFSEERLEGENEYRVPGKGLHPAVKSTTLQKAPPVLMLHLKRFDYDIAGQKQTKVNEKQDFALDLDLSSYAAKPSSSDVTPFSPTEDMKYSLLSVLVHSGDFNAGHYYAFIRPQLTGPWYRYDDERVIRVSERDALSENFGGDYGGGHLPRYASAYVLTYLRNDDLHWLLPSITFATLPPRVHRRFGRLSVKKVEKEVAEAHLVIDVQIVDSSSLINAGGNDLTTSGVIKKCARQSTLSELKTMIRFLLDIPEKDQCIWRWEERLNNTIRPSKLLIKSNQTTLEKAFNLKLHHKDRVLLFVHRIPNPSEIIGLPEAESTNLTPGNKSPAPQIQARDTFSNCVMLFVKIYINEVVTPVPIWKCTVVVHTSASMLTVWKELTKQIPELLPKFCTVCEEVRPGVLEDLCRDFTVEDAELGNGDILVFCTPQQGSVGSGTRSVINDQTLNVDVKFLPISIAQNPAAASHSGPDEIVLSLSTSFSIARVKVILCQHLQHINCSVDLYAAGVDNMPQVIPLCEFDQLRSALTLGWNKARKTIFYSIVAETNNETNNTSTSTTSAETSIATSCSNNVVNNNDTKGKGFATSTTATDSNNNNNNDGSNTNETPTAVSDGNTTSNNNSNSNSNSNNATTNTTTNNNSSSTDSISNCNSTEVPKPYKKNNVLAVAVLSCVHGELQDTLRVIVPEGGLIGQLKAILIEEHCILGNDGCVGFTGMGLRVTTTTSPQRPALPVSPLHVAVCARGKRIGMDPPLNGGTSPEQHPFSHRVRLFEVSELYSSVTQFFWDDLEPIPVPSVGLVVCVETASPDGFASDIQNSSFLLAPGLSSLSPYQASFDLTVRLPQQKSDKYLVQIVHFEFANAELTDAQDDLDDDVRLISPHSYPWLTVVSSTDTVRDVRNRIVSERPLASVLKEHISSAKIEFHIIRSFNHCISTPLAETDLIVPALTDNVRRRITPSLALHRPPTSRLRSNEGRDGPGISIRR
eukprot:TRINITY_DN3611_c0_g1_i1.p1 TRINITY_DN3611_c0_g1~~TRINITY_DN3611_c0_g1_i1.p1  ORF type:complete len:1337 (+),score=251.81 TRINITY_DN3611_c0_g1_i1:62-4072(+)